MNQVELYVYPAMYSPTIRGGTASMSSAYREPSASYARDGDFSLITHSVGGSGEVNSNLFSLFTHPQLFLKAKEF